MSARFPGFGPAMPRPPVAEVLKAALGAGFGLIVTAIVLGLLSPNSGDPRMVPLLIAPPLSPASEHVEPANPLTVRVVPSSR